MNDLSVLEETTPLKGRPDERQVKPAEEEKKKGKQGTGSRQKTQEGELVLKDKQATGKRTKKTNPSSWAGERKKR